MDELSALQNFGLNEKEAKTYIKLLELGKSTANDLSKHTGILRQTLYQILDKLISKGLVSHIIIAGVKYFQAADPSKFNAILKEKQKIIAELLPKLKSIKSIIKNKPKIEFYQTIDGLKSIYNDIINTKPRELFEYGNSKNFLKTMKFYFIENYIKRRTLNKIKLKLITEPDKKIISLYGTDKDLYRETRYLKEMENIKINGYIYKNKFAILTLTEQPFGIIIEDEDIPDAQRRFFNIMWGLSKDTKTYK